jgi:hypothetical protein
MLRCSQTLFNLTWMSYLCQGGRIAVASKAKDSTNVYFNDTAVSKDHSGTGRAWKDLVFSAICVKTASEINDTQSNN